MLADLLLVRKLQPWHSNTGKRLVKSLKVFVRDSGLLHTLLGIADFEMLLSHPIVGMSWEGFVIENILSITQSQVQSYFYRSGAGAEIDLILLFPTGGVWAIEIKRSSVPKLQKGFHHACDELQPERSFVIYLGEDRYPIMDSDGM